MYMGFHEAVGTVPELAGGPSLLNLNAEVSEWTEEARDGGTLTPHPELWGP